MLAQISTQAGPINGGHIQKLIEEAGFVCMVEVLVKLHRLGLRITEVPMILDGRRRAGGSKMRVAHTILGYFNFITRDIARLFKARWHSCYKAGDSSR